MTYRYRSLHFPKGYRLKKAHNIPILCTHIYIYTKLDDQPHNLS